MRFLNYLNEEYLALDNISGKPIYANPLARDLRDFEHNNFGVRFIIDDDSKNVYIADGTLWHPEFFKWLCKQKRAKQASKKNCFMGAGVVENNKIKIDSVSWEERVPKNIKRFIWAKSYFINLNEYLDQYDSIAVAIKPTRK